jgi:hypothetical protein
MLRKRRPAPETAALEPTGESRAQPVNVVVVVESGRRRRRARSAEGQEEDGHPLVKTVLGVAVAKQLVKRRKRPLSKRVKKAVRRGRRKVRKTARKIRRALR